MNVPLSSQWIDSSDESAVLGVLRSDHLSLGPRLPEFEEGLAHVAEVAHGVAVNSGTSALHLVVRALGLKEGDEVITTPFSFIASSNCLLFERVKPVFVDIRPDTYNIDPARIAAAITERTKAILAVDAFGQPAELDAIEGIARQHNLSLSRTRVNLSGPSGRVGAVATGVLPGRSRSTPTNRSQRERADVSSHNRARSLRCVAVCATRDGARPASGWDMSVLGITTASRTSAVRWEHHN